MKTLKAIFFTLLISVFSMSGFAQNEESKQLLAPPGFDLIITLDYNWYSMPANTGKLKVTFNETGESYNYFIEDLEICPTTPGTRKYKIHYGFVYDGEIEVKAANTSPYFYGINTTTGSFHWYQNAFVHLDMYP